MVGSARRVLNNLQIYDLHGTALVAMTKLQMIPQSRRRHQLIEYCWGFPGLSGLAIRCPIGLKLLQKTRREAARSKLFFIMTQFLVLAHWSRVELPSDLRTRGRRSKGGKKFCNQEARWEYYCLLGELIGIVWQLFCNSCSRQSHDEKVAHFTHVTEWRSRVW